MEGGSGDDRFFGGLGADSIDGGSHVNGDILEDKDNNDIVINIETINTGGVIDFSCNFVANAESTSASTNDTTSPVITLYDDDPLYVEINSDYVDPGANVYDEYDGTSGSATIDASQVNTLETGSYQVTFTASDIAGNTAIVYRTVIVENTPTPPINPPTEVWIPISHKYDDAEEKHDSEVKLKSSDLDLVKKDGLVGLRFNDIPVERGQLIENAFVQFTSEDRDYGTSNVTIYGHDTGNAPSFTDEDGNISSRPATNTSVTWIIPDWDDEQNGIDQQTSNLKSIIQEIINRPDWSSGNSIVIIISDGDGKDKDAHTYEKNPDKAAVLHITFT